MNEDVLAERRNVRVVRVVDNDLSRPYDDGAAPILRMEYLGGRVDQSGPDTSYRVADDLITAARHFGARSVGSRGAAIWERYARIFHGVTAFDWESGIDRDAVYVAFDPADWRESVGAPEGSLGSMTEWRAYCTGERYGLRAEMACRACGQWEYLDAVWGFYGDGEYLTDSARDMLDEYAPPFTRYAVTFQFDADPDADETGGNPTAWGWEEILGAAIGSVDMLADGMPIRVEIVTDDAKGA